MAMRSRVALALVLIFSSCTDGGRWMVSNTDLGVPDLEDPPPSLRGGSGSGRLFIWEEVELVVLGATDGAGGVAPPPSDPRQPPSDLCEGVGEGGGSIWKRVGLGAISVSEKSEKY